MTSVRTTDTRTTASTPRLTALDGLRGVAAVVVVVWHALLTTTLPAAVPGIVASGNEAPAPDVGSLAWWVFDTPLRVLSLGPHAVSVFFVLSGFVLAIPVVHGAMLDLWSYYPRRVLRLWLPAAASVVFAIVVIAVTRQSPGQAASAWGAEFSFPTLDPETVMRSFFLVTGTNDYNNPLWSLKWELLFSLFLPIALIIGLRLRGAAALWSAVAVTAVLSGLGDAYRVSALQYGPMFLAGVFLARLVATRHETPRPLVSWVLASGGVVLIAVPDLYRTLLGGDMYGYAGRLLSLCVVLGAALLVFALTVPSGLARAFASAPARFLGRISFGLYLVHAPLLLAGVHVFGDAAAALLMTVPLSFLVAWGFTRWVEEPSARLSRAVGRRAAALAHTTTRRAPREVPAAVAHTR